MSKFKNCCFTTWGPEPPKLTKYRYYCYGIEICPDTGRQHFQAYAEFDSGITLAQFTKRLGDKKIKVQKRYGSQDEAINYCKKDGKFFEFGERKKQGERTDLKEIARKLIDGSKSIEDIMMEEPDTYCRYRNGLKDFAGLGLKNTTKEFRQVEVIVLWGDPGTGKTREAKENNPSNYTLEMGDRVWFDGYNGEKCLIIDDFYGWIKYGQLLRILDGYQLRLEVKGSFTYANWNKVYITSNVHPRDWYDRGLTGALSRRINKIDRKCSKGNTDLGANKCIEFTGAVFDD